MRVTSTSSPELLPTKFGFFESAYHKLDRANTLSDEFEALLASYLNADPVVPVIREVTKGEWSFHVKQVTEAPINLSLVLGDAIHNYRTALDHLLADIVIGDNKAVTTDAQFPTGHDSQSFQSALGKISKIISGTSHEALKAKAPYPNGAWEDLYFLHKLDVTDKHNMLIPTIGRAIISSTQSGIGVIPSQTLFFEGKYSDSMTIYYEREPTLDGTIKVEPCLSDSPVLRGVAISDILIKFRRRTTEAIDFFANDSRFPRR